MKKEVEAGMLARTRGMGICGIDAFPVEVEVDMARGLPTFTLVGLPDSSVRESRERVLSAMGSVLDSLPGKRTTVNLAPADRRKEGSGFDLAIAVGLLAAAGAVPVEAASRYVFVGELSLDGALRPVRGMLSMAFGARSLEHSGLIVPAGSAPEAALVGGQDVLGARNLAEVASLLRGSASIEPTKPDTDSILRGRTDAEPDMSDVRGQEQAKRALEVAAAGGHNILMIGPPGAGKTMLARRFPGILPPLESEEALETTRIHSVAGILPEGTHIVRERPFRSPHHTVSDAGLVGGCTNPRPGEASLAHNGVLFLDELPEFRRSVLEVLRQPMEDGVVTISRASSSVTFPAGFMLLAAMNPCPCGFLTDPRKACICTGPQIQGYLRKISGPLLDRIDIHIEVAPVRYGDLSGRTPPGESSEAVRARVSEARRRQLARFGKGRKVFCNARMSSAQVRRFCTLGPTEAAFLRDAVERFGFSARAYDRILKLALTIADLGGEERIGAAHIAEAVQYRALDRDFWQNA
ncbi:MAG: YifB family Mg chelatase-like AAA ATPase [Candidatus Fermentibacter sp.]|nr:YifB family Mg chelatase-like AAA ATPase [Candidatus Fermentibacter sp.]